VTPSNVIVAPDGVMKLTDLGVAHALWGMAPHSIAKLGYVAPEVALGAVMDARADIFAVGVIAWELLAGRRLFDGATPRALLQQLRSMQIDPPSRWRADRESALDRIVLAALMRHGERTPSAAAMRAALQPFLSHRDDRREEISAWAHGSGDPKPVVPELEFEIAIEEPRARADSAPRDHDPEPANDDLEDSKVIVIEPGNDDV
jgi:hypothetical protein